MRFEDSAALAASYGFSAQRISLFGDMRARSYARTPRALAAKALAPASRRRWQTAARAWVAATCSARAPPVDELIAVLLQDLEAVALELDLVVEEPADEHVHRHLALTPPALQLVVLPRREERGRWLVRRRAEERLNPGRAEAGGRTDGRTP